MRIPSPPVPNPLARPLLELIARRNDRPLIDDPYAYRPEAADWSDHLTTDRELAELFGVARQVIAQWRNGARFASVWAADKCAAAIDEHPTAIWPEWEQRADFETKWAPERARKYARERKRKAAA